MLKDIICQSVKGILTLKTHVIYIVSDLHLHQVLLSPGDINTVKQEPFSPLDKLSHSYLLRGLPQKSCVPRKSKFVQIVQQLVQRCRCWGGSLTWVSIFFISKIKSDEKTLLLLAEVIYYIFSHAISMTCLICRQLRRKKKKKQRFFLPNSLWTILLSASTLIKS